MPFPLTSPSVVNILKPFDNKSTLPASDAAPLALGNITSLEVAPLKPSLLLSTRCQRLVLSVRFLSRKAGLNPVKTKEPSVPEPFPV